MAAKRRAPAKKTTTRRRPRPQPKSGGSGVGVRGSASASVGNGWSLIGSLLKDFSIIRFGGSGGGGHSVSGGMARLGRGARKGAAGFLGAIQGGRAGAHRAGSDDDDMGVGCVDCGGGDYHAPGCGQAEPDDYTIDVEVIDDRPALGPGGVS